MKEEQKKTLTALLRVIVLVLCWTILAAAVYAFSGNQENHLAANQSPAVKEGRQIYRTKNCTVCHSLYGLGGHLGPDLTNVYRRRGDGYLQFILSKGRGKMPDYKFTREEIFALKAFLKYMDGLGDYPLKAPATPVFGRNND